MAIKTNYRLQGLREHVLRQAKQTKDIFYFVEQLLRSQYEKRVV